MVELYDRTAAIIVAKQGDRSKQYDGLRVTFSIDKSSDSKPNTSKISVYNLNADSRKFVQQKNLRLQLSVGYKGLSDVPISGLLFQGDVTRTITIRQGPDFITTFEVGDEQIAIVEKTLQKSYKSGTFVKSIVTDLVSQLGVSYNQADIDKLSSKKFINGFSLEGKVSKTLDNLIQDEDYIWNIQDGEFKITKDSEKNINEAVLLSKDTGLIEIPSQKDEGIQFTALINTKVRPGSTVKVESDLTGINGFFKVKKVQYQGDTREGSWFMKVEAT